MRNQFVEKNLEQNGKMLSAVMPIKDDNSLHTMLTSFVHFLMLNDILLVQH